MPVFMRGQCRSLLRGRLSALYSNHDDQAVSSHTNLKCNHHASSTGSMLIDVNGPRNTGVMALTEHRLIARAGSMMMMVMMVRLLWKMAAAAEHVASGGCWSAGVYDAYNTQGSGNYLLPVAGRYMVDCQGSTRCYISPFYVLSNPLQICIPPLIYEWKLLPVVLQERDLDRGIWLAFCPFHN